MELKVVQEMLGHSSIVLTADTYTSVLPDLDSFWPASRPMSASRIPPSISLPSISLSTLPSMRSPPAIGSITTSPYGDSNKPAPS